MVLVNETSKAAARRAALAKEIVFEDHGCLTGDCAHTKLSECLAFVAAEGFDEALNCIEVDEMVAELERIATINVRDSKVSVVFLKSLAGEAVRKWQEWVKP